MIAGYPQWRKSTKCDSASCVEVARVDNGVMLRDSKDSDGPTLTFSRTEWTSFVSALKEGGFGPA
jgi:hypothetical protein